MSPRHQSRISFSTMPDKFAGPVVRFWLTRDTIGPCRGKQRDICNDGSVTPYNISYCVASKQIWVFLLSAIKLIVPFKINLIPLFYMMIVQSFGQTQCPKALYDRSTSAGSKSPKLTRSAHVPRRAVNPEMTCRAVAFS